MPFLIVLAVLVLCLQNGVMSLLHHREVRVQSRTFAHSQFREIEPFGFLSGGECRIEVSAFTIIPNFWPTNSAFFVNDSYGFVLRKSKNEITTISTNDQTVTEHEKHSNISYCALKHPLPTDIVFPIELKLMEVNSFNLTHVFSENEAGVYDLFWNRCSPDKYSKIHKLSANISMNVNYINSNGNYLSAGDQHLSAVYLVFCIFYIAAATGWIWLIVKNRAKLNIVKPLHYIILIPLLFKMIVLLLEVVRLEVIARYGHESFLALTARAFHATHSTTLCVVIVLVCCGWSIVKQRLDWEDKALLALVIFLECLTFVGRMRYDVRIPGFNGWFRDYLMHFCDFFMCAIAGMHAMKRSADFLITASTSEGKKQSSLAKEANYQCLALVFVVILFGNYLILDMFVLPALPFTLMWIAPLYTECTDMLLMFGVARLCLPIEAVKTLPK